MTATTTAPTYTIDTVTERQLAKTIDHSLLKPELDDAFIAEGCRLAAEYDVASVCVRPADVKRAKAILEGTDVAVGTVIGFPHGSSTTATSVPSRIALARGTSAGRQQTDATSYSAASRQPASIKASSSSGLRSEWSIVFASWRSVTSSMERVMALT